MAALRLREPEVFPERPPRGRGQGRGQALVTAAMMAHLGSHRVALQAVLAQAIHATRPGPGPEGSWQRVRGLVPGASWEPFQVRGTQPEADRSSSAAEERGTRLRPGAWQPGQALAPDSAKASGLVRARALERKQARGSEPVLPEEATIPRERAAVDPEAAAATRESRADRRPEALREPATGESLVRRELAEHPDWAKGPREPRSREARALVPG